MGQHYGSIWWLVVAPAALQSWRSWAGADSLLRSPAPCPLRSAEERKRKLKEAAKAMAEKGKGEAVFTTSRYGVEEGANARS